MTLATSDLLEYERALLARGEIVVGIDEVGRGALAGPLTVGAVAICKESTPPEGLNDSKLLSAAQREALVEPLRQWAAAWALGSVSAGEIDAWGLRMALAVAATRAIDALALVPTHALVDGSFNLLRAPANVALGRAFPPPLSYATLPVTTVVKGDRTCATIAAAAVLAKVHRDSIMVALDGQRDAYGWASNKGYGVPEHLDALRRQGPSNQHRQTWSLPSWARD